MNIIVKLQANEKVYNESLNQVQNSLNEIKRYLLSPKFHQDTTVQVGDILLRIDELESAYNNVLINIEA
jgi:hypothetical protein